MLELHLLQEVEGVRTYFLTSIKDEGKDRRPHMSLM